ncbi:murein biosynthesis integral membrane protein MurJ [Pelagibius sp.]|uniref:murein biosynthesis integral membrane protein MurJ n=1 Tax=Pelagibius sp. TaxID=1931238 RepID=UPI002607FF95|nr:murein biosynthesis integral membrane protein MurJ [Pelagibius sp.]
MSLLRSIATVGGYTGISRVLGFIRDILIANVVGASPVADAFFAAFRLPNLFRRLFAEGAFNAAFVPLFARRLEQEGEAAARRFAEEALSVLVTGLLILSAAAMAGMPWFIYVIGSGFSQDPEKLALAIDLSRITFPYLLFMAVVALLSGVLNSLYRFAAAAAAPILLNILFILALTLVLPFTGAPAHLMAWTVCLAGAAQMVFLVVAASRAGMALRLPWPRFTPGVRRLLVLLGPGVLSAGALQINIFVGSSIASWQEGAFSYLYYADRVYQLPLGLIGIAIGIVLLPDMARKLRAGAEAAAGESLNRGLEFALLLTLPATVALLVIPGAIVGGLFEHGAFGRADAEATAAALAAFAGGLPAYVLVKILQPAFYAREDTMTPFRFSVVSVVANIGLSLVLFLSLKHVGIALATALAAWLNTALLVVALRRRGFWALDQRFRQRLPRILAACAGMGALLWGLQAGLGVWLADSFAERVLALALLVAAGLAVYGALSFALGAVSRRELLAALRRRPVAEPDPDGP